jgi:hypothetical protein
MTGASASWGCSTNINSDRIVVGVECDGCPNKRLRASLKYGQVLRSGETVVGGKVIEEVHKVTVERGDRSGSNKRLNKVSNCQPRVSIDTDRIHACFRCIRRTNSNCIRQWMGWQLQSPNC